MDVRIRTISQALREHGQTCGSSKGVKKGVCGDPAEYQIDIYANQEKRQGYVCGNCLGGIIEGLKEEQR